MHTSCFFNLLWEYSIEYGNTQLSGPIREAGVAELSGPASAPSLSASGTTRGHRSLGRQCPSAPPAALQSDNFRPPPEMLEMWRQKRRQRKIEQPPGKSGKVGRCLALLGSEWDVQKGPDPPKLGMPECRSTHLSMKPDRIEASCRGDRRAATWGLRRACRPGGWACSAGRWLRGPSASSGCSLPTSYSNEYVLSSIASCPSL